MSLISLADISLILYRYTSISLYRALLPHNKILYILPLPPAGQVGRHHVTLLVLCALRCIFIPAFLFCNAQVHSLPPLHHWITNVLHCQVKGNRSLPTYPLSSEYDVIPIITVLLFGLSNGYLGSIAMVIAPQ